jgi:hypothetical protein
MTDIETDGGKHKIIEILKRQKLAVIATYSRSRTTPE